LTGQRLSGQSLGSQWLCCHSTGGNWESNDVNGDTPGVVRERQIVTLRLDLDTHGVRSELGRGRGPGEGSQLGESVTPVADASVVVVAGDLGRDNGTGWGCGEGDGDTDLGISQVLVISDVVDYDLLTDVSVEGLLVLWRREVGVGGGLSQSVGDQSGSGVDTGGVTGGAVGIVHAGWVGGSDTVSVTESGSDLNVEEVVDGDPVTEVIGDDLLGGPVVLGEDLGESDFSGLRVDGHAWGLVTSSLLGG